MTEHPMLFSPPMISALLREATEPGTGKTQTRRTLSPTPERTENGSWIVRTQSGFGAVFGPDATDLDLASTMQEGMRIKPGDRVWCRETWRLPAVEDDRSPLEFLDGVHQIGCSGPNGLVRFEADGRDAWLDHYGSLPLGRLRQGRHLPRELSRLTLYVSEVRVQRLQEISEADAVAEGIQPMNDRMPSPRVYGLYVVCLPDGKQHFGDNAVGLYAKLWAALNGPGSWDANPWIYALTFRPVLGNIDTLPATLEDA